jgi:hypothetical protein
MTSVGNMSDTYEKSFDSLGFSFLPRLCGLVVPEREPISENAMRCDRNDDR